MKYVVKATHVGNSDYRERRCGNAIQVLQLRR